MKAFVSGEAGLSVIVGPQPQIRQVHGATSSPWNSADALRVLDGCSDVRIVEVANVVELDNHAELAWAQDRALRIFLFLLDPREPREELIEYAECLAELLDNYAILLPLKWRLASIPLPGFVEILRVEHACARVACVRDLVQWLLVTQAFVIRAHEAFEAVPNASFGGEKEQRNLRTQLVEEGRFFEIITDLSLKKDLTFLRLKVASQHRAMSGAISQWFDNLQGDLKKMSKVEIRDQLADTWEESDDFDGDAKQPSHAAFSDIMDKQRAIVAVIKERDLDRARSLMSELAVSQRVNSTPEQIAKSFCNMAQQARRHDVPNLALEWSREATVANPVDPKSFGHFANSLIDIGSYAEAEDALNSVERCGDPLFAATGRARILRLQGRVSEAREAFVAAARTFEGFPDVVHAQLGAAEARRELGDIHGALADYESMSIFSPEESGVWVGLASTQVDLGQLEQALQTYSKLATRDRHSAQIGSAHAYRIFGSLHEALRIYDEELVDLPNDCVALCGRGEVLKDIGKLDLALAAFELAIRNSPYRPEPVAGKVNILRNMGRFDEALRVNNEARSRFHSDRRFEFALIAIYRAQGRYSEALVALDRFNAKFPFDARGRVARAAILSRLSAVDEAMGVYESILAERPHLHGASMGKAALLIRLRRYSEAAAILQPNKYPSTRSDWRTSTLRAFLVEAMEGYQVASELLNDLIRRCPFASERRRMRDLLATVELRQGHWVGARNLVESNPEELSNVIILRVLATTHRTGKAREYLARIRQSDGPADIADLAEEIARRHRITEEAPRHSGDWIETTERNILLADAA